MARMRMTGWLWIPIVAMTGMVLADDAPEVEPLNQKVVVFCKDHMGEKVGNGECAGLAYQALKAAGAKDRTGPDSPQKGDYVWGSQVFMIEAMPDGLKTTGNFADVEPGDIIQFRDTKFITAHFEHHTAVVEEITDVKDRKLRTFQQNVGGQQIVKEGVLKLDNLKEGWLRFFRPVKEK